ncbi:MAG: hypothetical protein MUO68_06470 [Desulfobacteraceae bacterium]|nr:hypothetical protein [Desulfobacteraceae bacterium]
MRLKSEMLEAAFGRRDAILRDFNKLTLGLERALKEERKRLFRRNVGSKGERCE